MRADIGNCEQVTFTVLKSVFSVVNFFNYSYRWVDNDLNVHEDFIGLYAPPDITATTIVSAIQDTLAR